MKMKKSSNISATALHRFIPQPASGRSSALPCLAAFLVLSDFWRLLRLHGLFFRPIVPKGSSFDDYTQETVNLIFSHVNAVKRKQFNGKSAYDLFTFYYSAELASALGISFVDSKDVIQSPALLKLKR